MKIGCPRRRRDVEAGKQVSDRPGEPRGSCKSAAGRTARLVDREIVI
jgi:hypothetical protein